MASWMTMSALSAVLPCGRKPPRTLTDCGMSPVCPITATPAPTTALTASARPSFPPAPTLNTSRTVAQKETLWLRSPFGFFHTLARGIFSAEIFSTFL